MKYAYLCDLGHSKYTVAGTFLTLTTFPENPKMTMCSDRLNEQGLKIT